MLALGSLKQEALPWLLRTWPIRRPGGYLVARLLARLGHQHRVPCLAPPAKPEQEPKENSSSEELDYPFGVALTFPLGRGGV